MTQKLGCFDLALHAVRWGMGKARNARLHHIDLVALKLIDLMDFEVNYVI